MHIFVQSLETGEPLELFTTFTAFTTDAFGLYTFNVEFGLMKSPQAAKDWRNTMQSVAAATSMVKQFPRITQIIEILPSCVVEYCFPDMRALLKVHSVCNSPLHKLRCQSNTEIKEVWEQVSKYFVKSAPSNARSPQNPSRERYPTTFQILDNSSLLPHEKSPDRLQQEGVALLLSEEETVARILVHATFHFLRDPEILAKAKQEVDSVKIAATNYHRSKKFIS
jgi:hypothetical protein